MGQYHTKLKEEVIDFVEKQGLGRNFFVFPRLLGNVYLKKGVKFVPYRSGVPGQCDLFIYGCGMAIEVELKGPGDKLRDSQIKWMHFCRSHGIPWILIDWEHGKNKFAKLYAVLVKIREQWIKTLQAVSQDRTNQKKIILPK